MLCHHVGGYDAGPLTDPDLYHVWRWYHSQ